MNAWQEWLHNWAPLEDWLQALIVAALGYLILSLASRFLTRHITALSERTSSRVDDVIAAALAGTKNLLIFLLAILIGLHTMEFSDKAETRLSQALVIVVGLQVAIWLNRALSTWMEKVVDPKTDPALRNRATTTTMVFLLRLAIMLTVLLAVLANLGVNITAFVASLGIGGIAIALALQTILSDLFASLSIGLDKPFEVGDFIIVDDLMGTVEYIGVKTTRLRSLSGEQLIRSNAELLKSAIRNYKRMAERRVVFTFGIKYETPIDKVAVVGGLVRDVILAQSPIRFDRAHFFKFGTSSLDFEVVYYVLSPDYNVYMDIQQQINLELMRACAERDIGFAYPNMVMQLAPATELTMRQPDLTPSAEAAETTPEGQRDNGGRFAR
ncbi:mechanosensitive ion channel family protein [Oxalicibacterium solurbis]|uniref:Mechanosensitive ion channel protein MscS n=1 Tax=Oxalicibacterium solurbis TaxID=69280 RepID=A0A8J3B569_9BURK|nr:mechanosensitive ion channel family protein [Oxalicibacterium solurbis]GGI55019.1 mechanosensitive ion channel protein MscS [Oxalicibacterium solurbis]